MCVGSEFQVDGAETENAREVKLLVMPVGLACLYMPIGRPIYGLPIT